VLRSLGCRGGRRQYHVDVEGNEFGGKSGEPICLACRKPSLNGNILSLDPATFPQSLQEGSAPIDVVERCKAAARRHTTSIVEIPDEPDFGGLLSVRRWERPDRCSTEESYELAPSHAEHSFLPGAVLPIMAAG
jgi:hypothetical protein